MLHVDLMALLYPLYRLALAVSYGAQKLSGLHALLLQHIVQNMVNVLQYMETIYMKYFTSQYIYVRTLPAISL